MKDNVICEYTFQISYNNDIKLKVLWWVFQYCLLRIAINVITISYKSAFTANHGRYQRNSAPAGGQLEVYW